MKRPLEIKNDLNTMDTLVTLTSAFEGIASAHLARIRTEVLKSNAFFEDLWQVYSKIRVDKIFHFGRRVGDKSNIDKELLILITAEGGFSGDVDIRLVRLMIETYDAKKHDVIVIGKHGVAQLEQRGIKVKKFYPLPLSDMHINVSPLVKDISDYSGTTVFYPKYLTLTTQKITSIKLSSVVQEMGEGVKINDDVITEINYIFEPSVRDVVSHLERSMLFITVSQLILDSKLAQYASRFQAMSIAHHTAFESKNDYQLQYRRAIRGIQDERLKEIINSLRMINGKTA
jgi:ATP synthase F1 gamma subunit